MHPILRRNAEAHIMYGFVVGAIAADGAISVRSAIRKFKVAFLIDDLDVNSTIRKFNRMRCESLRNQNILK